MEKYVLKLPRVYQSHQPKQKHFVYIRYLTKVLLSYNNSSIWRKLKPFPPLTLFLLRERGVNLPPPTVAFYITQKVLV